MLNTCWKTLLAGLLGAALLVACGGDDGPADGTGGDVDLDTMEAEEEFVYPTDGDEDREIEEEAPPSVLGHWSLTDTSAFTWFQNENIQTLYWVIDNLEFFYWMETENGPKCWAQSMTRETASRFVPTDDPDSCWYELTLDNLDRLTALSRHRNDTADDPWTFIFERIDAVPDFDAELCIRLNDCIDYNAE